MRSLVLFDLHYQHNNPLSKRKLENIISVSNSFGAVILGGDNAELSNGLQNHRILFEELKNKFDCPIGFILGNHELWGKLVNISSWRLLNETFLELGREYGFTYLEQENLDAEDCSFVGTYGHFDYSFLRQGSGVSMKDLLRGTLKICDKKITWKDRNYMDWESRSDEEVCAELVNGFNGRLKIADKKLISISHTIPRLTLNGWPDSQEQYFIEAYSGSNLLGNILEANGGEYHFCGHTHARARSRIGNTDCINVGSDYNLLRYVIMQTDRKTIEEREIAIV